MTSSICRVRIQYQALSVFLQRALFMFTLILNGRCPWTYFYCSLRQKVKSKVYPWWTATLSFTRGFSWAQYILNTKFPAHTHKHILWILLRVSAKALDKEAAEDLLQSRIYLKIMFCLQDKPATIKSSECYTKGSQQLHASIQLCVRRCVCEHVERKVCY